MTNILDLYNVKGKSVIITGGHGGIGLGICKAFAQGGANIAIVGRNKESGLKVVNEIEKMGNRCIFIQADITDPDDCDKAVKTTVKEFGKLDIGINNAGIVNNHPAETYPFEDWVKVINVNLTGTFLMCQSQGKQMIKQGNGGAIINTSSMSSYVVNTTQPQAAYNASKSAVNQLTKSLAYEWAKYDIRVNAVAPGYIKTPLLDYGIEEMNWGKEWIERTPQTRLGTPEEVGGLALYLASDVSPFITGEIVVIDGGYTIP